VEVAIVAEDGRVFRSRRFTQVSADLLTASLVGPKLNIIKDDSGKAHDVVLTSLRPNGAWAMLSRPSPGAFSYFFLRPLTTLGTPLLAFTIALVAAWIAIDKLVLTWLYRLQRRAAAYGAGHYRFRDVRTAEDSPRELADLAISLDLMAARISERDASQRKLVKAREDAVREIHHRVKNNLQIVTSFLSLQSRQVQDPAARSALASARFRIDALSLVHQTLYQHERLETVKVQPFLDGLLTHMAGAMGLDEQEVEMKWSIDEAELPSDAAIPLALFTVEAVTNAAKYGFQEADRREGVISVTFRVEAERYILSIADNGVGAGNESDRRPESTGLGRRLMLAFARQLHGEQTMSSERGKGYTVTLTIPKSAVAVHIDQEPIETAAQDAPSDVPATWSSPAIESPAKT
jgi:two-component sensor histidine kinase